MNVIYLLHHAIICLLQSLLPEAEVSTVISRQMAFTRGFTSKSQL